MMCHKKHWGPCTWKPGQKIEPVSAADVTEEAWDGKGIVELSGVAQLGEQRPLELPVEGSSPSPAAREDYSELRARFKAAGKKKRRRKVTGVGGKE